MIIARTLEEHEERALYELELDNSVDHRPIVFGEVEGARAVARYELAQRYAYCGSSSYA